MIVTSDKMEDDTFPDVTLANNSVMEQRALNARNQNETGSGKDTFVILRPRQKRYQISCSQTILVLIIAVVVLIIAIVITAFVTKSSCSAASTNCYSCKSIDDKPQQFENTTNSYYSQPPNLDPGDKPWSAIRLPRSLIPELYEIRIKIDLTTLTYQGGVNLTILVNTSTKYIVFHRNRIDVDKSTVSVSTKHSPDRRVVNQFEVRDKNFHVVELDGELTAGNTYVLSVGNYTGQLATDLKGLYLSSYKNNEGETRNLAVSQLQTMDARSVFPCFDEPNFKARFKLSIVYQKGYTALTNMPNLSTTVLDKNWVRTDYEVTPVMSTYLLAIVVSDFKSRNYTFPSGYQLRIWARPDAYSQTEYALDFAKQCYVFFEKYFNTADVVPKQDHVAVPDFSAGAMENWGLVVYRETALLYDRHVSSSLNKYTVTFIVAHEIAHTWFGNIVTMQWWDDLWLNEGFASLLMYIAMDNVYSQWNVFAIVIVDDILPVMVEDALTTSHPISSKIVNPEEIPQHFDSISYNKGMAVLRMMRDFAGDDNFRDGLRNYIEKYRFKNADMAQLWAVFTESFNYTYDVPKIMDTWTRQMGYPMVTVEDAGSHYVLHQKRFLLDPNMDGVEDKEPNPLGYKWYIPFTYVTQAAPGERKTEWLNLGSATIPKPSNGWLLGNYEIVGFYRVMYDRNMWGMLAEQLMTNHTVISEANRAGLIGDAFVFARANLLDYDVALNLTRYLKKEQSYIPWQAFLHSVEFIKGMLSSQSAYIQLQHYIQELVSPVFDLVSRSDKGELPDRYLRRVILTMACDIGMEKAVNYATSMFDNWMKHDNRLPPDLSMLIYSVGIREGGVVEWDYVWNKTRTTDVTTESEMMMESLAQTQKPWLLWRYINWLFDKDKIRLQNVRFVISYFSKTPLARMVVLEFMMSRWDEIVKKFDNDSFLLRDVIPKATIFVNTDFHLKQLEALFKENTPRSASNAVENALALIKANIGWMEANYKEITDWLDDHKL